MLVGWPLFLNQVQPHVLEQLFLAVCEIFLIRLSNNGMSNHHGGCLNKFFFLLVKGKVILY